ncbi:MAG: hypothetical protein QF903_03620 [Planctomycetota bacterium]|jgi:hypothetical protein|nr:hypothetical protein [Planctomycetota bacterium]MDP6762729.1 hypothetical protein [Planctomycetota bacterium]MDP6988545.1 hypothetical protein [Planctomycetota bacterium]
MSLASECRSFRASLERALSGRPVPAGLRELSWHEHLLGCGDCRELLEREEALEELLASLPAPRLSPELARRVLERLRVEQEARGALDALLELDPAVEVPAGLGGRVLDSLASQSALSEDERLDLLLASDPQPQAPAGLAVRLLEGLAPARAQAAADARLDSLLARDPAVVAPVGLAEAVLHSLEDERFGAPRPLLARLLAPPFLAAAAAGLLIALFALRRPPGVEPEPDHVALSEPPPEMLELFDVLAEDLLFEDGLLAGEVGLEVDLSLSLGAPEEVLMEYEFPEALSEEEGG